MLLTSDRPQDLTEFYDWDTVDLMPDDASGGLAQLLVGVKQ